MLITAEHFSDPTLAIWLALFPLTYLAHIAEEYWAGGGYSDYLRRTYSVELSMLGAVVIGNALVHVVRSINDRIYVPGLITAITLWLPLGFISLKSVWPNTSPVRLVLAFLVGFAANLIVEVISLKRRTAHSAG